MTCHEARELLSALVDDALGAAERDALDAHLAACADCRRELQRVRDTVALLRAVEPARAPVGFVDRVLEATRPAPWPRRLLRELFLPWPVKLPVEAAAVVLVTVGVVYLYLATPELQQAARLESPAPTVAEAPHAAEQEASKTSIEKKDAAKPSGAREVNLRSTAERDTSRDTEQRRESQNLQKEAEPAPSAGTVAGGKTEAPPARSGRVLDTRESQAPAAPEPSADALKARRQAATAPAAAAFAPSDVSGGLAVNDRDAALRALTELVARLGGVEDRRVSGPERSIVELTVPREAYAEFARELARLGRWQPTQEPAELPARVRIVLRITG
jgi:Putative zinc-finger